VGCLALAAKSQRVEPYVALGAQGAATVKSQAPQASNKPTMRTSGDWLASPRLDAGSTRQRRTYDALKSLTDQIEGPLWTMAHQIGRQDHLTFIPARPFYRDRHPIGFHYSYPFRPIWAVDASYLYNTSMTFPRLHGLYPGTRSDDVEGHPRCRQS
jgi:hypothetical protein